MYVSYITTGLFHHWVKILTHFLTQDTLCYMMQALQIHWHLTTHLKSQASLTFESLTFDFLDFFPYVFRLINASFLPHRQLLVSVHFRVLWKSTSETCLRKVIHHNGHLFIFILCQCCINGCKVMHFKSMNCFENAFKYGSESAVMKVCQMAATN